MLVLSRKLGESFFVGDAKIVVLRQQGSRVKLGIDAPDSTPIRRSELLERPREPVTAE